MQINSISTSQPMTFDKNSSFSVAKPAADDQAVLNMSADSFSGLVKDANAVPEVRGEVVDAFKARVKSGHYPAEDVINGLINLMGGKLAHLAKTSSSAKQA